MKHRPRLLFAALVVVDLMAVCMIIAVTLIGGAGIIPANDAIFGIAAGGIAVIAATIGIISLRCASAAMRQRGAAQR